VNAGQAPALTLLYKNLCHPKLTARVLAPPRALGGLTADDDGGVSVESFAYVIPVEGLVLVVARRKAVDPLGLCQRKASRPHGHEIVGQHAVEKRRVAPELGLRPLALNLSNSVCMISSLDLLVLLLNLEPSFRRR
jgi:hypothetical protein